MHNAASGRRGHVGHVGPVVCPAVAGHDDRAALVVDRANSSSARVFHGARRCVRRTAATSRAAHPRAGQALPWTATGGYCPAGRSPEYVDPMRANAVTSILSGVLLISVLGCSHQEGPTRAEQAATRAENAATRAQAAASRVEAAAQRAETAADKAVRATEYSYRK